MFPSYPYIVTYRGKQAQTVLNTENGKSFDQLEMDLGHCLSAFIDPPVIEYVEKDYLQCV